MEVYIGYRLYSKYVQAMGGMGGTSANSDDRLATAGNGAYLLTFDGLDYAVSDERGGKFTEEVLAKCTGKHRGFFPEEPPYDNEVSAAIVEISKDREHAYYDMDAAELLKMLTALRDESGEPLDRRGVINHCYPNPRLPEGDFDLTGIIHRKYIPDNTPVSVIPASTPDKVTSEFRFSEGEAVLEIRDEDIKNTYHVPAELIPEIKEKVRQLCSDPAEAYVEDGAFESFVRFGGKDGQRIFTYPDKTIELLKEIASKSELKGTEEVKGVSFYGGATSIFAFNGVPGPAGAPMQVLSPEPASVPAASGFCTYCGAPRTGGRFCTECGGKFG